MARIKANTCECNQGMKRLYVRAEGGNGWDPVGWQCQCGCICMDEGNWKLITCSPDCCDDSTNTSDGSSSASACC